MSGGSGQGLTIDHEVVGGVRVKLGQVGDGLSLEERFASSLPGGLSSAMSGYAERTATTGAWLGVHWRQVFGLWETSARVCAGNTERLVVDAKVLDGQLAAEALEGLAPPERVPATVLAGTGL